MTDEERKQEGAVEEIEDLDASEDAEQIKGGALQSYLNLEGKKQGKIENQQSSRSTSPAPN